MSKQTEIVERIIRNCFSRVWNKQFLTFLFFLFLSFCFWLFITLNSVYKEDFTIPVKLINIPEKVVITTPLPKEVHVVLSDKGLTLLSYEYIKNFVPLAVDFNNYASDNNNGYVSFSAGDLLKQIDNQLASSTQISGIRPQQLEFYYNYGEKKRLPICLISHILPSSFYYISEKDISPDSVDVYAPQEVLDTIKCIYTKPYYRKNISDTLQATIPLQPISGAKYMTPFTHLQVVVDRLVEKTVQVPVQQVNFPAAKLLRTFPAKVSITFQVGMKRYQEISADQFVLVINYEDVKNLPSSSYHLSLKSVPEGVYHPKIDPQNVEFVIEDLDNSDSE